MSHTDAEQNSAIVLNNPRLLKLGKYVSSLCRYAQSERERDKIFFITLEKNT